MRILHVSTFLQGGVGRSITDLAIAQRRAGHDLVIAADSGRHTGYESYSEYIAQLGSGGVAFHTVTSLGRGSHAPAQDWYEMTRGTLAMRSCHRRGNREPNRRSMSS